MPVSGVCIFLFPILAFLCCLCGARILPVFPAHGTCDCVVEVVVVVVVCVCMCEWVWCMWCMCMECDVCVLEVGHYSWVCRLQKKPTEFCFNWELKVIQIEPPFLQMCGVKPVSLTLLRGKFQNKMYFFWFLIQCHFLIISFLWSQPWECQNLP